MDLKPIKVIEPYSLGAESFAFGPSGRRQIFIGSSNERLTNSNLSVVAASIGISAI